MTLAPDLFRGFWYTLMIWDKKTAFHCIYVAQSAKNLATVLGLHAADTRAAWWAGLLHDLGKIGIPREILHKPGPLTLAERDIINTHPERAAQILTPLASITLPYGVSCSTIIKAIVAHHERWDGGGYPYGLSGSRIPLLSRIIAVVDAYHSMRELRPYRRPLTLNNARKELERGTGKQFDPLIVNVYLSLESKLKKKSAHAS